MGFEVYYHFSEKIEGQYQSGDPKSFKKRVGDPFEDVPLEKLAASITAQLARRDILISEVEIYELSKKKISFKETKNGIIIKNKKFLFDDSGGSLSCVEEVNETNDANDTKPCPAHEKVSIGDCCAKEETKVVVHPHEQLKPKKIIDYVLFSPEPHQVGDLKSKPFRLTVEKRYGVMEKRPASNGIGDMYLLLDDKDKEYWVSDLYFVPAAVNLFGDKELGFSSSATSSEECKLSWGDSTMGSMPDIRRK